MVELSGLQGDKFHGEQWERENALTPVGYEFKTLEVIMKLNSW